MNEITKELNVLYSQVLDTNERFSNYAIGRIADLLTNEALPLDQYATYTDTFKKRAQEIFPLLEKREGLTSGAILIFCWYSKGLLEDNAEIASEYTVWINTLKENHIIDEITFEALKIITNYYGSEWSKTKKILLSLLDNSSLLIRSIAANKIGDYYCNGLAETPSIPEIFQLIKEKEIEKPGIATPFWFSYCFRAKLDGTEYNYKQWFKDILHYRTAQEPVLKFFGDGLEFEAYDFFGENWNV